MHVSTSLLTRTHTYTCVLSQLWCYGACRTRGMAKMVRKSKCQRKLLIVSAVAFALPFRRQEMWRQKAKEPWKNKKPHNVKNQVAEGEICVVRCGVSTSAELGSAQCRGGHCVESLEVIWPLLLARNDAHVVPAFLTLPLCQVLNRLPARRLAWQLQARDRGRGGGGVQQFTRLLKISLSLSLRRKF